jgi:putative endonuclease
VYYAYILLLQNGKYYHGYSENLKQRYEDHQRGIVKATKDFLPARIIFYAAFSSKEKARIFEKYLKSSSGHAFRNKHIL